MYLKNLSDFRCLFLLATLFIVLSATGFVRAQGKRIAVIAHRGNHVNVPENTLAAYQEAIRVKADYVEVDLRTTKDRKLVVLHDATVDRTSDGKGKISQMTLAEVKKINLKSADGAPYAIPEFSEVLNLCKGKIGIYLDFKEADVPEAYRQIKDAGMQDRTIVYLNKPEQYAQWKAEAPKIPLMTSLPDDVNSPELFSKYLKTYQISIFDNITQPDLQKAAHQHNCKIWLDVQSKDEGPEKWQKAIALGIDGLQTDHPEELVKYLRSIKR